MVETGGGELPERNKQQSGLTTPLQLLSVLMCIQRYTEIHLALSASPDIKVKAY